MGMNLKQWGLAVETEYDLRRIGQLVFTREKAEQLRDDWAKEYPNAKPLYVINLKTE